MKQGGSALRKNRIKMKNVSVYIFECVAEVTEELLFIIIYYFKMVPSLDCSICKAFPIKQNEDADRG